MENTFLSLLETRRSYRGSYTNKPVPKEDLERIMRAGLAAPSGCNMQTTSLIAVDDEALLSRIRQVIVPPICETAPAMICVLTRRTCAYRDRCFSIQDYSAAAENMLLAIHALGYESCWYEGHITDNDRICDKISEILSVPKELELVCILPVGSAAEPTPPPKKKSFHHRASFNRYEK
ncbi:MAG: nitroreductase family protein [Oscillospiraceae bacterium]